MTTKTLRDALKHCIGKNTIIYLNDILYHFGSPILTVKDNKIILDSYYWDFSASTSRVRNKAISQITGSLNVPNTKELRVAYTNGEILSVNGFNIWFSEWVA